MRPSFKKKLIRVLTAALSCCYVTTTVAWSAPVFPKPEVIVPSLVDQIYVPEPLGIIRQRFVPNNDSPNATPSHAPVIVHIQDAHAIYEAQTNTKKILDYLTKEYGFKLVFVEGGVNRINPRLLEFFKTPAQNKKTAEQLAKEGIVTGAELFMLDQLEGGKEPSVPVEALGVENPDLFKQNLKAFRENLKLHKKVLPLWDQYKSVILTAGSRHFNKKLKSFFDEWLFYQDLPSELLSHLRVLQTYALSELQLDFSNPREQLNWPQLVRIQRIKSLEAKLDEAQARADRLKLAAWIQSVKGPEEISSILNNFENPNFELKDIRAYFERFYEKLAPAGFSFETYPQFTNQIAVMILNEELDSQTLLIEMNRLSGILLGRLAKTQEEKALVSIFQDWQLLKRLFALELIRDDFKAASKRKRELRPTEWLRRFESLYAPALAPCKLELSCGTRLDALYFKALEFYQGAELREGAIFQNMIRGMQEKKIPNAILITGGFHSEGLLQRMEEQGIAYVEVTPHIKEFAEEGNYKRIMNLEGDLLTLRSHIPFAHWTSPALKENLFESEVDDYLAGKVLASVADTIRTEGPPRKDAAYFDKAFSVLNESPGFKESGLSLQALAGGQKVLMLENEGFAARPVRYSGEILGVSSEGRLATFQTASRADVRHVHEIIGRIEKMLANNQIYNVPRLVAAAIEELINESKKNENAIAPVITRPLIPPYFNTPRKIAEGISILKEGLKRIKGFDAQNEDLLKTLLEHYQNQSDSAKPRSEVRMLSTGDEANRPEIGEIDKLILTISQAREDLSALDVSKALETIQNVRETAIPGFLQEYGAIREAIDDSAKRLSKSELLMQIESLEHLIVLEDAFLKGLAVAATHFAKNGQPDLGAQLSRLHMDFSGALILRMRAPAILAIAEATGRFRFAGESQFADELQAQVRQLAAARAEVRNDPYDMQEPPEEKPEENAKPIAPLWQRVLFIGAAIVGSVLATHVIKENLRPKNKGPFFEEIHLPMPVPGPVKEWDPFRPPHIDDDGPLDKKGKSGEKGAKQTEESAANAPWRFAPRYSRDDLVSKPDAAARYMRDFIFWESKFHQPGIGYNAESGLTYDGHAVDSKTGELLGGARNWSASSKESLHIAMLLLAILGDEYARLFISPQDPAAAERIALEVLTKKISSYERFNRTYPGFGGFLPWFLVSDQGLRPTDDWQDRVPGLDNGQLAWSLYAASYTLQEKGHAELARRYRAHFDLMAKNAVKVFYDGNGRIRAEAKIRNTQIANPFANNFSNNTADYFLDDPYEGELMTFLISLFGELDPKEVEKIWDNKRKKLEAVEFPTPQGILTVARGHWFSGHEPWKYLKLPYVDVPAARDVFVNGEKARTWYSHMNKKAGAGASMTDTEPQTRPRGVRDEYLSAVGIPALARVPVRYTNVSAPYAQFSNFLAHFAIAGPMGVPAAWLDATLDGPRVQTPYGVIEGIRDDGTGATYLLSWDGKVTLVLAMSNKGGIHSIVAGALRKDGKYQAFYDRVEREHRLAFPQIKGKDIPFATPNAVIPSGMSDYVLVQDAGLVNLLGGTPFQGEGELFSGHRFQKGILSLPGANGYLWTRTSRFDVSKTSFINFEVNTRGGRVSLELKNTDDKLITRDKTAIIFPDTLGKNIIYSINFAKQELAEKNRMGGIIVFSDAERPASFGSITATSKLPQGSQELTWDGGRFLPGGKDAGAENPVNPQEKLWQGIDFLKAANFNLDNENRFQLKRGADFVELAASGGFGWWQVAKSGQVNLTEKPILVAELTGGVTVWMEIKNSANEHIIGRQGRFNVSKAQLQFTAGREKHLVAIDLSKSFRDGIKDRTARIIALSDASDGTAKFYRMGFVSPEELKAFNIKAINPLIAALPPTTGVLDTYFAVGPPAAQRSELRNDTKTDFLKEAGEMEAQLAEEIEAFVFRSEDTAQKIESMDEIRLREGLSAIEEFVMQLKEITKKIAMIMVSAASKKDKAALEKVLESLNLFFNAEKRINSALQAVAERDLKNESAKRGSLILAARNKMRETQGAHNEVVIAAGKANAYFLVADPSFAQFVHARIKQLILARSEVRPSRETKPVRDTAFFRVQKVQVALARMRKMLGPGAEKTAAFLAAQLERLKRSSEYFKDNRMTLAWQLELEVLNALREVGLQPEHMEPFLSKETGSSPNAFRDAWLFVHQNMTTSLKALAHLHYAELQRLITQLGQLKADLESTDDMKVQNANALFKENFLPRLAQEYNAVTHAVAFAVKERNKDEIKSHLKDLAALAQAELEMTGVFRKAVERFASTGSTMLIEELKTSLKALEMLEAKSRMGWMKQFGRAEVRFVELAEAAVKQKLLSEAALENIRSWARPAYRRVYPQLVQEFERAAQERDPKRKMELWTELDNAWYTKAAPGTAGMRGKLGLGTNRISEYTVGLFQLAHALTVASPEYNKIVEQQDPDFAPLVERKAVVLGGDSRHQSYDPVSKMPGKLIKLEALVNVVNGVRAYVYRVPVSTPQLAWSVHQLDVRPVIYRLLEWLVDSRWAGWFANILLTAYLLFIKVDRIVSGSLNTASHNPRTDNGNKPYKPDGSQSTGEFAALLNKKVAETTPELLDTLEYDGLNILDHLDLAFDRAVRKGDIRWVGGDNDPFLADEQFMKFQLEEAIYTQDKMFDPDQVDLQSMKVVISPLYGVSRHILQKMLRIRGLRDDQIVWVESEPNPDFPGIQGGKPNPEEPQARASALVKAHEVDADLILWTDPDADRPAVAFKTAPGDYLSLNGNQQLALITDYLIRELRSLANEEKIAGDSRKSALARQAVNIIERLDRVFMASTVVSGDLMKVIARNAGLQVVETLTGFKYIGDEIEKRSKTIQRAAKVSERQWRELSKEEKIRLSLQNSELFLFGGEESLGSLTSDGPHDKDAIAGVMWFVEIAGRLRAQGISLSERLNEIYRTYGYFAEGFPLLALGREYGQGDSKRRFSEAEAMQIIRAQDNKPSILGKLRKDPPQEIAGKKVIAILDFDAQRAVDSEGHLLFDVNSQAGLVTAQTPGIPESFAKALSRIPIPRNEVISLDRRNLLQGIYSFRHQGIRQADGFFKEWQALPRENFVMLLLEDGSKVIVRPSGTEPVVKFYINARTVLKAGEDAEAEKKRVDDWIKQTQEFLIAFAAGIAEKRFPRSEVRSAAIETIKAAAVLALRGAMLFHATVNEKLNEAIRLIGVNQFDDANILIAEVIHIVTRPPHSFKQDSPYTAGLWIVYAQLERANQLFQADPLLHQSRSILIVEDEALVRKNLAQILRGAGFRVLEAGSVRQAREKMNTEKIDMLLTDFHLPDGDGGEVIDTLRYLDSWVPVTLMSGLIDQDGIKKAIARHKDIITVEKPIIAPAQLILKIKYLLAKRPGRSEVRGTIGQRHGIYRVAVGDSLQAERDEKALSNRDSLVNFTARWFNLKDREDQTLIEKSDDAETLLQIVKSAAINKNPFDLVVLDAILAGGSHPKNLEGFIKRIRSASPQSQIFVSNRLDLPMDKKKLARLGVFWSFDGISDRQEFIRALEQLDIYLSSRSEVRMLLLGRSKNQYIQISDDIRVEVLDILDKQVILQISSASLPMTWPESVKKGNPDAVGQIGMQKLNLGAEQEIHIGNDIHINIVEIWGQKVRLGITAPTHIPVHRGEVYEAILSLRKKQESGLNNETDSPDRSEVRSEKYGDRVNIYPDRDSMGKAAAELGIRKIKELLKVRENESNEKDRKVRIVFAAAPSQVETIKWLVELSKGQFDWRKIEFFHMDEFAGYTENSQPINGQDPPSFRYWLNKNLIQPIVEKHGIPREELDIHFIPANSRDKSELEKAADEYGKALGERPVDIVFGGYGYNGHVAFNDPPADFMTTDKVIVVNPAADEVNKKQQMDDYGEFFKSEADIPLAVTISMPAMKDAKYLIMSVPGKFKADAIKAIHALTEEGNAPAPDPMIPGTYFNTLGEDRIQVFTDLEGASLLPHPGRAEVRVSILPHDILSTSLNPKDVFSESGGFPWSERKHQEEWSTDDLHMYTGYVPIDFDETTFEESMLLNIESALKGHPWIKGSVFPPKIQKWWGQYFIVERPSAEKYRFFLLALRAREDVVFFQVPNEFNLPREMVKELIGGRKEYPEIPFLAPGIIRSKTYSPTETASYLTIPYLVEGHLGEIKAPDVHRSLVELKNPDPEVRYQAAKAFTDSALQTKQAIPSLIAALKDNDQSVRWQAVRALYEIHPELTDAPALIKVYRESDVIVRYYLLKIIVTLAQEGKEKGHFVPSVVDVLAQALKDSDVRIRHEALTGITELNIFTSEVMSALGDALNDQDEQIRNRVKHMLPEIKKNMQRAGRKHQTRRQGPKYPTAESVRKELEERKERNQPNYPGYLMTGEYKDPSLYQAARRFDVSLPPAPKQRSEVRSFPEPWQEGYQELSRLKELKDSFPDRFKNSDPVAAEDPAAAASLQETVGTLYDAALALWSRWTQASEKNKPVWMKMLKAYAEKIAVPLYQEEDPLNLLIALHSQKAKILRTFISSAIAQAPGNILALTLKQALKRRAQWMSVHGVPMLHLGIMIENHGEEIFSAKAKENLRLTEGLLVLLGWRDKRPEAFRTLRSIELMNLGLETLDPLDIATAMIELNVLEYIRHHSFAENAMHEATGLIPEDVSEQEADEILGYFDTLFELEILLTSEAFRLDYAVRFKEEEIILPGIKLKVETAKDGLATAQQDAEAIGSQASINWINDLRRRWNDFEMRVQQAERSEVRQFEIEIDPSKAAKGMTVEQYLKQTFRTLDNLAELEIQLILKEDGIRAGSFEQVKTYPIDKLSGIRGISAVNRFNGGSYRSEVRGVGRKEYGQVLELFDQKNDIDIDWAKIENEFSSSQLGDLMIYVKSKTETGSMKDRPFFWQSYTRLQSLMGRRSEVRSPSEDSLIKQLKEKFNYSPITLEPLMKVSFAAGQTIHPQYAAYDRQLAERLLDLVIPKIDETMQPFADLKTVRAEITDEIEFMDTLMNDPNFRQRLGLPEWVSGGAGQVILTTAGDWPRKLPVLLAAVPMFAAFTPGQVSSRVIPYRFAGDPAHTRELKNKVFSAKNGLTEVERSRVSDILFFDIQRTFAEAASDALQSSKQVGGVAALAGHADHSDVAMGILRAIENPSDFEGSTLSLTDKAVSYFYRARLLQELASQIQERRLEAQKMGRELADSYWKHFVSVFFQKHLPDVVVHINNNGSFDLSLSIVQQQLETFRVAHAELSKAA